MLKDIMLRTRATGKSVEAYFQQFCQRTVHGTEELNKDEFMSAVKNLGPPWAEDRRRLASLHQALDHDQIKAEKGNISLEEIAWGVLDCVQESLQDCEHKYLETTYQILKRTSRL